MMSFARKAVVNTEKINQPVFVKPSPSLHISESGGHFQVNCNSSVSVEFDALWMKKVRIQTCVASVAKLPACNEVRIY